MNSCVRKCAHGGLKLHDFEILTPIGTLAVEACSVGLHKLKFKNVLREEFYSGATKICYVVKENRNLESVILINNNYLTEETEVVTPLLEYLNFFFIKCLNQCKDNSNINENYRIPSICWESVCSKDSFTEKVLKVLYYQKLGSTITYKNLGLLVGNQNAQRAVGSVMRKNPVCLVIPCHRVVKSGHNDIGNYTGGVEIKEWLLKYEKNFM
jgi:O-6-methylguanine DNA methyltransferase